MLDVMQEYDSVSRKLQGDGSGSKDGWRRGELEDSREDLEVSMGNCVVISNSLEEMKDRAELSGNLDAQVGSWSMVWEILARPSIEHVATEAWWTGKWIACRELVQVRVGRSLLASNNCRGTNSCSRIYLQWCSLQSGWSGFNLATLPDQ